uniref:Uncharacterized protein n=1 Tax=Setaria italica TaxID=4555 RepID=K3XP84_SETIT
MITSTKKTLFYKFSPTQLVLERGVTNHPHIGHLRTYDTTCFQKDYPCVQLSS